MRSLQEGDKTSPGSAALQSIGEGDSGHRPEELGWGRNLTQEERLASFFLQDGSGCGPDCLELNDEEAGVTKAGRPMEIGQ